MNGALETHAKRRGLFVGAVALAAVLARLAVDAPPERSIEGVAALLGRASGGTVSPDDFLWEGRGGFLHDAFVGRRVLFLASRAADGAGAPRDLYRARVRLTRAGRPISVHDVKNLTRTPLGDDRDLAGSGHYAAFATATGDGVQGVTLLDLDGASDRPVSRGDRFRAAIDRWLTTGATRGLARTEIAFTRPPAEAKLEVGAGALVLSLGSEAVPAALDFGTGALATGRVNAFGAGAHVVPERARSAGEIAADLVRAGLGVGAGRAARALFARAPHAPPRRTARAPEGLRVAADYPREGGWPPAPIAPVHPQPFDGEGFWHAAPAIQSPAQQIAAPPILEAIVRPDANNPAAIVHLIAIDTRRLDVRIAPGTASPEPVTGPHGAGRLPRGPAGAGLVAAFVAGPAPAARPLGFLGEGRLFSPLVAGAPTLAARPDGRAVLGAWPEDAARDAFVAIAQGPSVLGQDDAFAPRDAGAAIDRAALCRTADGYIVYAFGTADAAALRAGLSLAACTAAVHLGAAPAPLGFAYARAGGAGAASADAVTGTLASDAMSMPAASLGDAWPQEIGIVTLRVAEPASFSSKKAPWAPDSGDQPTPAWLPGVFRIDTEQLGAKVRLTAFMPSRVTFRIAVGSDEGGAPRGAKPGPSRDERGAALAALGLSVSRRAARKGLFAGGAELIRATKGAVWLALQGSHVTITRPGEPVPSGADATEVTLVADENKLLPAAREVGTQRPRSALCALPDGTVVVAHATFDTDEATTETLLEVGCERVVALDRGAHDGVFVHRGGTERSPDAVYEATAIYVLSGPGTGTAAGF